MLRSLNGWSWSDAFSDMPTRGYPITTGLFTFLVVSGLLMANDILLLMRYSHFSFVLQDIVEAKEFLKGNGVDVSSDFSY